MARKRISEFRAKTLLAQALGQTYNGISITTHEQLPSFEHAAASTYAVKVDQGVKGRFKKGLVVLNQSVSQIPEAINQLQNKGYSRFLVEPMTPHDGKKEQYIALERTREGMMFSFSHQGGIDIESHHNAVKTYNLNKKLLGEVTHETNIPRTVLENLINTCNKNYITFLEINPFIIHNTEFIMLDAAIEVDSTAEFFVNDAWSQADFTDSGTQQKLPEEISVQELAAKSQAAFSLEVLNPNGSIFMMLSGGGASIVLADEVYNQGYGKQLANYGEYSGNPNAEETYIYAKNVLSLLIKSEAAKKVLIIAGGVANFTDVRVTFTGLIKAIGEMKHELQSQQIKIFVRRGGPYQEEGLKQMQTFLEEQNLLGIVRGPDMVLTEIVTHALHTV